MRTTITTDCKSQNFYDEATANRLANHLLDACALLIPKDCKPRRTHSTGDGLGSHRHGSLLTFNVWAMGYTRSLDLAVNENGQLELYDDLWHEPTVVENVATLLATAHEAADKAQRAWHERYPGDDGGIAGAV